MQGVPDDVFQHDVESFPDKDPRITAELAKQHEKALKEQKHRDAEIAKQLKKAQAAVKRAQAMPVVAKKDTPAVHSAAKEARERELKAHKIRLYFKKLGHKLTMKEPKTLPRNDDDLDELLASIECELHSQGGIDQAGMLFINGSFAIEAITQQFNPLGLRLSGPAASLTQTVAANRDKWEELMTEVAIANAEWFMVSARRKRIGVFGCKRNAAWLHMVVGEGCFRRFPTPNGWRPRNHDGGTNGWPAAMVVESNHWQPKPRGLRTPLRAPDCCLCACRPLLAA